MADQREASPKWIVRAVLYNGDSVAYTYDDALSAVWHLLGLLSSQYPARQVMIERPTDDDT